MTRVIAIIPARGGSKGLKNKNLLPLCGKPLIAYSIEAALQSEVCDRVLVTTDSGDIRAIAKDYGAWVPFLRDASLAEDLTPTEPVLQDALARAEEIEDPFDIVVFLQPTDIFRQTSWIVQAVETLKARPEIESAFVAQKTHKNFWYRDDLGRAKRVYDWMAVYGPRQTRTPLYREDTGLALATRAELVRQGRRTGDRVEIIEADDFKSGIDIHTAFDFRLAETVLKHGDEWEAE